MRSQCDDIGKLGNWYIGNWTFFIGHLLFFIFNLILDIELWHIRCSWAR